MTATKNLPTPEWTCDGCPDRVPDGAGHYVNDMRVCKGCAEKLQREGS